MPGTAQFTFIYSNGTSYLSVESDASKGTVKVGCLGMGPAWGVSDHTWDYDLTGDMQGKIESVISDCGFSGWDECYVAAYEPDLEWEFITVDTEGNKRRSFGQGMRAEHLDEALGMVRDIVVQLSREIYLDMSGLEAVYFCRIANKENLTTTVYRDLESVFERTPGVKETKFRLPEEKWTLLTELVTDDPAPKFGFGKEQGGEFVSRALYLGGKMVSYTYAGKLDPVWKEFEKEFLKLIGQRPAGR